MGTLAMIGVNRYLFNFDAEITVDFGPDQDQQAGAARAPPLSGFFETHFRTNEKPSFDHGSSFAWHFDQRETVHRAEASLLADSPPKAGFRGAVAAGGTFRREATL